MRLEERGTPAREAERSSEKLAGLVAAKKRKYQGAVSG